MMGGPRWNADEDDCLRAGSSSVAGRSSAAVAMRRFHLGLTHRTRRPRSPEALRYPATSDDLRILIETIGRCEADLRREMSRRVA